MARILILALWLAGAVSCNVGARDLDKLYEKAQFKVGGRKITAYIADDESKREQGLMYIEKLPEDTGMLFVFDDERPLGFWMKNTLIPLNIGFFDHGGTLVDVQEMKVASSMLSNDIPTYQSKGDAQFALEMGSGWFTRHKIKAGAKLELDSTSKSTLLNGILIREKPKSPAKTRKPSGQ